VFADMIALGMMRDNNGFRAQALPKLHSRAYSATLSLEI